MPDKYGLRFPAGVSPLEMELFCFRQYRKVEQGGLGGYGHLKKVIETCWPNTKWHDWMRWRLRSLCDYSVNAWTGCAAAGKTWDAGVFAMAFYLADPQKTSVILTSTTGKMVRKRIWPVIRELFDTAAGRFPGNLVDSKTTLQAVKGDDKHGIFAIAVREGNTSKAVADIQGLHAERMLLIIDEATDTPEAVFEAISNLRKGCVDFRLLSIGNPVSRIDPHGRVSEPRTGWKSVGVEDEEWETKGVQKWEIESGVCLHFDGIKSPNVRAGETKFPFLISKEDVDRALKAEGSEQSISFWKYTRGFWPPEGVCKTVMSEAMVDKFDGAGRHTFLSSKVQLAALDAAFGGDKCILRFFELGDLPQSSLMGIQLLERVEIVPLITSKEPIHYQIANRVIAECKQRGIPPRRFGLDASGEGGGLADIIMREWDHSIQRIEFGGAPSDMPASLEDTRPASEVYDRRVTELWFSCRNFLISGQLKGLNQDDIVQFCSREFRDEKRKIILDDKETCRKSIGRSPDDADAVAVAIEMARRLGAVAGEMSKGQGSDQWDKKARQLDAVYQDTAAVIEIPEMPDVWPTQPLHNFNSDY